MRQNNKRAKSPKDPRPLHKRKRVHFSGGLVTLIVVTVIVLALNVVSFPGVQGLVAQKIEEQLPAGYAADFQKAGLTLREGGFRHLILGNSGFGMSNPVRSSLRKMWICGGFCQLGFLADLRLRWRCESLMCNWSKTLMVSTLQT